MKNRYIFFKNLFPNYLILFLKKGKYYSFGFDKKLMPYKDNINYVVINEDNTVIIFKQKHNCYVYYYQKLFLINLLETKTF